MKVLFWIIFTIIIQIEVNLLANDTKMLRVVSTANVHGETDPCGWKKRPLGGLARKATIIDQLRSEGYDVLILDAGNLLFKKDKLEVGTPFEVAKSTAKIIVDAYNKTGCHAFSPGSKDFAAGLSFIQNMQSKANFPFISANIKDINGNRIFDPYTIIDIQDLSVGIIGLASKFIHSEVLVENPLVSLSKIINEVDAQSDIVILLFDSEESDIKELHNKNFAIDFMVRSKAKLQSQDGGNKKIPVYSCGDRGKYLYQYDLNIKKSQERFLDIAYFEKQINRANQKLNKMKEGNLMADLYLLYKDDPSSLQKIERYQNDINYAQEMLANSINTIKVKKHALDKNISDRPDILNIVDKGKMKIEELFGPQPKHDHDHHHHHHH